MSRMISRQFLVLLLVAFLLVPGSVLAQQWTAEQQYPLSDSPIHRVLTADVNGDHATDVLFVNDEGLWMIRGKRTGGLQASADLLQSHVSDAVIGDFTGNGKNDVLYLGVDSGTVGLYLRENTGLASPIFMPPVPVEAINLTLTPDCKLASTDWDNDGKTDIAVICSTQALLGTNAGDGHFAFQLLGALPVSSTTTIESVSAGDFDLDGYGDIVVVEQPEQGDPQALVLYGGPKNQYRIVPVVTASGTRTIVGTDFNGNGAADLIGVGSSGISAYVSREKRLGFGDPIGIEAQAGCSVQALAAGRIAAWRPGVRALDVVVGQRCDDSTGGSSWGIGVYRNARATELQLVPTAKFQKGRYLYGINVSVRALEGNAVPTGEVLIAAGNNVVKRANLVDGRASFDLTLAKGEHRVMAAYAGEDAYASSIRWVTIVSNDQDNTNSAPQGEPFKATSSISRHAARLLTVATTTTLSAMWVSPGTTVAYGTPISFGSQATGPVFYGSCGVDATCSYQYAPDGYAEWYLDGVFQGNPTVTWYGDSYACGRDRDGMDVYCEYDYQDIQWSSSSIPTGTHTVMLKWVGTYGYTTVSVSKSVTITAPPKTTPTINLTCSPNPIVYNQNTTCTATVSGGATPTGNVTFTANGGGWTTVTLDGSGRASATGWAGWNVGTYPVGATYNGDSAHYTASTNTSITINKTTPSVSVSCSPSLFTFGQSTSCTANVSGGATGTVTFNYGWGTYTLDGSGNATASNGFGGMGAGTYTVTATYNGSGNFNIASGSANITINKKVLTVTANNSSKTYGATNPAFSASYSGFVNGETSAVLSGAPSLTTTATAASPVGNYTIAAAAGTLSAANYSFTFVNGTLSVNKAPLTVTANNASKTYGAANPSFSASYSGFVNGDTSAVLSGSASLTTAATSASATGSYAITASQGTLAATNYTFSFANGTLTINKAVLTVDANDASKTFGTSNPTFSAAYLGFVNGDTSAVLSGAPSLTSSATSASPAGTYTIIAAQGTLTAANYMFTFVNGVLTVNKAVLTVTANNLTKAYGDAVPTLTVSYSGFVNGDTATVLTGTPSVTTTATSASVVGSYPITVAAGTLGATNYSFSFANGTLTIIKGTTTLGLWSNGSPSTYGNAVTFTASNSVGLSGTFSVMEGSTTLCTGTFSGGGGSCTYSGLTAGSHTIVASWPGSSQWNPATSSGFTQVVNKATPTITWPTPANISYGTTLSGTQLNASANVPGSFVYSPSSGALLGAGVQTLSTTFTPTDTANYTTATSSVSLGVDKAIPTATLTIDQGTIAYGQTTIMRINVNCASSCGSAEFFVDGSSLGTQSLNGGGAAIASTNYYWNDSRYTVGNHAVLVKFSGNANYAAVDSNTVPLTITKAVLTVTANNASKTYGSANPVSSTSYSGFLGPDTTAVLTGSPSLTTTATAASPVGTYPITVSQGTLAATNYSFSFANGTLTVGKANLAVAANNATRAYGDPNPEFTATYSGFVNGDSAATVTGALATAATPSSPAGTYPITIGTLSSPNYTLSFTPGTLTVTKATPSVTWVTPAPITYGAPLGSTQLSASSESVAGVFSYSPAAGTVLPAGTHSLSVTFTPNDGVNYETQTATTSITVNKAIILVSANDVTIPYASPLWDDWTYSGFVNGDTANVLSGEPALATTAKFKSSPVGQYPVTISTGTLAAANYTFAFKNGTLTIVQGTPSLSWIAPTPITFGAKLWAGQLNASASTTGTFIYNPPSGTVLSAGTHTLTATFTPSDQVNYLGNVITTTITVKQATPVITWPIPASVPGGSTLTATQLNATANVPGTFVYTPPIGTTIPYSGTQTLSVTFTPTDSINYATATASVSLTIQAVQPPPVKTTPVITWNPPAPIYSGTALSGLQLNASANVPGTFSYSTAFGTVLPVGTHTLMVSFTPTDTTKYTTAGASTTLVVNSPLISPTVTWNTPAPITYGSKVWAAQLNATANVAGTFVYSPASGTILPAGNQTLTVTFTPTDPKYSSQTASVNLLVKRVDPVLTWTTPAPIFYGTKLWAAQLNASASVPGTFTYNPPAGTALDAGPQVLTATFTPTDVSNYNGGTVSTTLTVKPATPVIQWPVPASLTAGTALSGTQLNATANVIGTFAYTPAAGSVMASSGTQSLSVVFTPTDTRNYTTATASTTLTILASKPKTVPAITWSTPAPISFGTALTSAQLNATANTDGTFAYSPAAGTVLNAGVQQLTVVFTPTDSVNFSTASASVMLTVNPSLDLTITWNPPAPITYGAKLWAAQLNATASVAGIFTYSPASGTILNAGVQTLTATFTPADSKYPVKTISVPITVNQAKPTLMWAAPAAITYGTKLWAAQLNASSTVAGSFVYDQPTGTILEAGTHNLTATFKPTDSVNYSSGTVTTSITVKQAMPVVMWATPAAVVQGSVLGGAQLSAKANVPGNFTYTPVAGTVVTNAGPQTLTVTFTPDDQVSYQTTTASTTLTVVALN